MNRKHIFLILIILAGLAAIAYASYSKSCEPGAFDGVKVVNAAGAPITGLYTARTATDEWSENLLPETLADGKSRSVQFNRATIYLLWDLKAEFGDGSERVWTRLKLPYIYEIKLTEDDEAEYVEIKGGT